MILHYSLIPRYNTTLQPLRLIRNAAATVADYYCCSLITVAAACGKPDSIHQGQEHKLKFRTLKIMPTIGKLLAKDTYHTGNGVPIPVYLKPSSMTSCLL